MQVNLTTTPTRLDNYRVTEASSGLGRTVTIGKPSAAIVIGGPNITSASNDATDGFPYTTTDPILQIPIGIDGLWARTVSGTATVEVLHL